MDDDFVDYTFSRPRYRLAGGDLPAEDADERDSSVATWTMPLAATGVVLIAVALLFLPGGVLQFFGIWFGIALVLGPYAPRSVTGGDCRIGVGEEIPREEQKGDEKQGNNEDIPVSGSKGARQRGQAKKLANAEDVQGVSPTGDSTFADVQLPRGWTSEDVEMLQRAMSKHPKGTARRWEVIAQTVGGRKPMEEIVILGKQLAEAAEKKASAADTNSSSTVLSSASEMQGNGDLPSKAARSNTDWTEVQDLALVKALKQFSKETAMRWDRVGMAVPGKSKQQCFKRFTELRNDFRSEKKEGIAEETAVAEEGLN